MSIRQYLEEDTSERSLPETIYLNIREDIISGTFTRGSRLTEQSICSHYKVSRTPVREALGRLESEGLVTLEKNRGAFISGFSGEDTDDLLELRRGAEVIAIRRAIENADRQDIAGLDELFEFMEFYTDKNDINRMMTINSAFHKMIHHSTHNSFLERLLNRYDLYVGELRPENYFAPDYLRDVLTEHRAIYDAIKKRDAQQGVKAMLAHLDNTEKRMSR